MKSKRSFEFKHDSQGEKTVMQYPHINKLGGLSQQFTAKNSQWEYATFLLTA